MADTAAVDTKEATTTTVATPEKKIVDDENKKVVEDVDEDSKASENGEAKEVKENGSSEEKESTTEESKEPESTENGDSTDAPADACCIKRKSTATVVSNDSVDGSQQAEGASPEKKAKLEDKSPEAENNGGEAEAAA